MNFETGTSLYRFICFSTLIVIPQKIYQKISYQQQLN